MRRAGPGDRARRTSGGRGAQRACQESPPCSSPACSEGCGAEGIKSLGTKAELAVTWARGDTLLVRRG